MAKLPKITFSDVNKKRLRIIGYLISSGVLGLILSMVVDRPELAAVFVPAINFVLYSIVEELKNEGYVAAIRKGK